MLRAPGFAFFETWDSTTPSQKEFDFLGALGVSAVKKKSRIHHKFTVIPVLAPAQKSVQSSL